MQCNASLTRTVQYNGEDEHTGSSGKVRDVCGAVQFVLDVNLRFGGPFDSESNLNLSDPKSKKSFVTVQYTTDFSALVYSTTTRAREKIEGSERSDSIRCGKKDSRE